MTIMVQPENLLLDASGHVKVTDLGFAKSLPKRQEDLHTLWHPWLPRTRDYTEQSEGLPDYDQSLKGILFVD